MTYDFHRLPRTGIAALDAARQAIAGEAEETQFEIVSDGDLQGLQRVLLRFVTRARDHVFEEQHLLAEAGAQIHWWRYAYLDRVLDEMERASAGDWTRLNPAHVKVLMEMWSFEQLDNAPSLASGSLRPFDVPPTFTSARL